MEDRTILKIHGLMLAVLILCSIGNVVTSLSRHDFMSDKPFSGGLDVIPNAFIFEENTDICKEYPYIIDLKITETIPFDIVTRQLWMNDTQANSYYEYQIRCRFNITQPVIPNDYWIYFNWHGNPYRFHVDHYGYILQDCFNITQPVIPNNYWIYFNWHGNPYRFHVDRYHYILQEYY